MRTSLKQILSFALPVSAYRIVNEFVASADIHARRRWEPEVNLIANFVQPGDTVVDVGANHGLYSFHLSRLVGQTGTVHAFEPIPYNFQILARTTRKLANVVKHPQAVGDAEAEADFILPMDRGVPLSGWAHRSNSHEEGGVHYKCRVVTLDRLFATERISFIKCDVEGGEMLVFRGAVGIIERFFPVVFCELADGFLARYHCSLSDAISFFTSRGYAANRVEGTNLYPPGDDGNYLFTPLSN